VEVEDVVGRLLRCWWKRLRRTPGIARLLIELEAAALLSGIIKV
jgi:hypothetical protein